MILKFAKQLKLEETLPIRKAFHDIFIFNETVSSKFIAKDMLEKEESFPALFSELSPFSCELLKVPLKTHRTPVDRISTMPNGEMACRMERRFSVNEKAPNLSIKLFNNGKPHIEFRISLLNTEYENAFNWDIFPFNGGLDTSLRTLVGHFCNRYSLYQDIGKSLRENKAALSEKLGEAFASDLINLFSAKKPATFAFKVPEENRDKELIVHISDKKAFHTKGLYLGDMLFPSASLKKNASFSINKNNELLIFLYTNDENLFKKFPLVSDKCIETIKNLPELNKQIALISNIWLENYVAYGNFCSEIYGKIRPKVLLNNL